MTNETVVSVQLTDTKLKIFRQWFSQNEIKPIFAYGKYYFERSDDALAFRIKFEDILMAPNV